MSITVVEASENNLDDLCMLCMPPDRKNDPVFMKGVELKKIWARDMLKRWGSVAKIAYVGESPAGLIQYTPVPDEMVVRIICIFVPYKEHWRRGVGKKLLTSLIEDMRSPKSWFGGKPPLALVTKPFPGEMPGQYPARNFFIDMGFKQVEEDPSLLYYPLKHGFVYTPVKQSRPSYMPQKDDKGKVVIIYGSSFCPWSYLFLKKSGQEIEKAVHNVRIRWINSLEEPAEAEKRGISEGVIVNGRLISSFILDDREAFIKEVLAALEK
ncbi:GNAT family N-acetyltransferase [Candidatus Methanodesulfokora washburnensis]|uniref:GNAT family N-acetyltransferase n=1 Tax=Candidatus Methanodesulfokora washburnensis TaxID=2478471 RepID=UPI000F79A588|nr:GNAT family N-acetyltransferase [Candidatus Methanodesulfokores washburnensis]